MNEMLKTAAPHALNGVKVVSKIVAQLAFSVFVAQAYIGMADRLGRRILHGRPAANQAAPAE